MYSKVILNESYPWTYNLPGIVATVALIMLNVVSRDDLAHMGDAYDSDEGSEVIRCLILRFTDAVFVH